jgi:hypothetical protein
MNSGIPPHHPNMLDDEPLRKNGLICWRDKERPCSAECMAFDNAPSGPEYDGKQWANCKLLVDSHRTGKHLTILAQQQGELVKAQKNEAADRLRLNQPPPPKVA